MTSQIIPTNPTAGSATTSSVRENFRIADEEITQLQRSNIDAQDLTGGPISYNVTYPADPAFALVDGVRIAVRVNVTNSSTVTDLNVNGTGGVPIKSVDGESLSIGDLVANQYYELMLNAVVPASPYWACLNINKNVILSSLDVEGQITCDGLKMDDGEYAQFGTDNDLKIWHSGTNSYIQDSGEGQLVLNTTNGGGIYIEAGGETMAQFISNGTVKQVSLYHDNALKFATTATGIDVTGTIAADAIKFTTDATDDAQIFTELTGTTTALVIQSKDDGDDSIVLRSHNTGVGQVDVLVATRDGIDVTGRIAADYINLNGNNPLDPEGVTTGDVLCKRIRFDDPTDDYSDLFQIFAEKNASSGNVGHMVLEAKDNADDKIIFRMGNYPNGSVDILTASANFIRVPADKRFQFGTESSGYLEIFEAANGNGYLKQVGDGNLVIQATDGYLYSDTYSVAYWDTNHIKLKYQNNDKLQTTSTGVFITGNTEGGWFRHDTDQVEGFDGSWNSFGRNGGSNVLYVQQGRNDTEIASFRKDNTNTGNTAAAAGVEVVGIKHNGIRAIGYFSSDGSEGVSGTANSNATLTIKNGLIVAVS